jgi:hypothetical protein
MWIFTNFGFFSAVEHRADSTVILVRSRARGDLEALLQRIPESDATTIRETPRADYRWRVSVDRDAFRAAIGAAIDAIDYDNFKSSVGARHSWARESIYARVWGVLHQAFSR